MPAAAFLRSAASLAPALLLGACGSAAPTQPPGAPPSPGSVTRDAPGGDAYDAHRAALARQNASNFGWRTDKDNQARFPLPDQRNWKRVRFLLFDHFVGFKYGDDQHSISSGFLVEIPPGAPNTSAACVERFERDSLPKVAGLGGQVGDYGTEVHEWRKAPLVVRKATGKITFLGIKYEASLAWAGYPAYPGACLVYAVAIPWDGNRDLAEEVRDTWTGHFWRFRPLTEETPYRHE